MPRTSPFDVFEAIVAVLQFLLATGATTLLILWLYFFFGAPVVSSTDPSVAALRAAAERISDDHLRVLAKDASARAALDRELSRCEFFRFPSGDERVQCAAIGFPQLQYRWREAKVYASLDRGSSGDTSPRAFEPLPPDAPIIDRLLRIAGVE